MQEEIKKENDKKIEIENNSVEQDIFVIPTVARKINQLNENRIIESFECNGNYAHNYNNNNHGGCYENVCNAENEHDYGDDDMMIDENEHTHDEREKEREKEMRIDINKNKHFTNKNYYNEKTIFLTDEEIEKKEKITKLSKMLLNYSMALNRSLGVVGGRSVTIPEGTISW